MLNGLNEYILYYWPMTKMVHSATRPTPNETTKPTNEVHVVLYMKRHAKSQKTDLLFGDKVCSAVSYEVEHIKMHMGDDFRQLLLDIKPVLRLLVFEKNLQ